MKLRSAIFGLAFAILSVGAANCATELSKLNVRGINAVARVIQYGETKITFVGSAHIQSADKVAKTSFDATADSIVAYFFQKTEAATKRTGMTSVKSAVMEGPVRIVYIEVDASGNTVKTTATADKATYDGVLQMAHLIGNVKIVRDNPDAFEEPAVMTGEKADVNLKPNLGADEMRFKVESENGVSTIDIKRKAQPKKEAK